MSGLIKQEQALRAIAALPTARPKLESDPSADLPAPDPRLSAMEAEIERLKTEIDAQKRDIARAVDAARREGRAEAVADDAKRTRLVEHGIAEAQAAWNRRLEDLDVLAVKLARTALVKVFGDCADLGDLVTRTVAHHLGGLAADAVIGVRVSAEDFPGDAIDALAARLDIARSRLAIDPDLDAGGCRIDLKLGAIDVEPARQWAVIDRTLAAMERAG